MKMKLPFLLIWIEVGTLASATWDGIICLKPDICGSKCCPQHYVYDEFVKLCTTTANITKPNITEEIRLTTCNGAWSDNVEDQDLNCIEDVVSRHGKLTRKAFLCDLPSKYVPPAVRIPLRKCCNGSNVHYDAGNFDCRKANHVSSVQWPPPVYSVDDGQLVEHGLEDFHITHELIQCPTGYVPRNSIEFKVFEDGTLEVPEVSSKLDSREFCINSIVPSKLVPKEQLGVHYCVNDPCVTTNCVRKCCLEGYLLNLETQDCEATDLEFTLEFKNQDGEPVDMSLNHISLRSGLWPACVAGINLLNPDEDPEDEFYILPSGYLYVPSYPARARLIKEYCVDDFLVDNRTERKSLICFVEIEDHPAVTLVLSIFPYFMFVSSFFLIATFVTYAILPEIRNIHGLVVMCHSASLAVTYICLGVIQLTPELPEDPCIALAIMVHFFFLASFTWLNIMSFNIWNTFRELRPRSYRNRDRIPRRFIFYSCYGWGIPLVIVAVGQIIQSLPYTSINIIRPDFGLGMCWFSDWLSILAYFYGPVALILLSNVIFFVLTAIRLYKARSDTAIATKNQNNRHDFFIILSLFILMGVTWITELIPWLMKKSTYLAILFDSLNILTGIFIFCIFVCKRKILILLRQKFARGSLSR